MKWIGIALVALLAVFWLTTYTVGEREHALLFSLGEIKQSDIDPGLHFKLPLINNVRKFDARVLTLDAQPERFLTNEKKNVIVDFFVKWRIDDPGKFYRSFRGDERNAQSRLAQIIKDEMRNEFGQRAIREAVAGERAEIMGTLTTRANTLTNQFGIDVVDVRISRIELPEEVNDAVYARMRAERERVAQEFRARGREEAERVRANADRERTVILANAYRDAEGMRGAGDAQAAETYARAYGEDQGFYNFYRSLNAYRNTFSGNNDVLVLKPDNQFFRYFEQASPPNVPIEQAQEGAPRSPAPPEPAQMSGTPEQGANRTTQPVTGPADSPASMGVPQYGLAPR